MGRNRVTNSPTIEHEEKKPKDQDDYENVNNVKNDEEGRGVVYGVESTAPWHVTVLFVLQQTLLTAPGMVVSSSIVHTAVCGGQDYGFLGELVAISMFMCGLGSVLQIWFGIRLPVIQGPSFGFIPTVVVLMSTEKYKCPANATTFPDGVDFNGTQDDVLPPWNTRIRVISGSLMVAACVQTVLAVTGVLGLLLPYIGPLTIGPAVSLIGLSLFPVVAGSCQHQWGIAILTAAIMILLSIGLRSVKVPLPTYVKSEGWTMKEKYPLFRLIPKFFAVGIPWLLCYILTVTDVFPNDPSKAGYMARTDVKMESLYHAKWFFIPYPGRYGPPLFDFGIMVSLFAATLIGMFESIGDYHVLAACCDKPTPPTHAVNRGLAVEGFVNVISGGLCLGVGTSSYSETVGFINISGMASRMTWLLVGGAVLFWGAVGKLSGALALVPEPILGGLNITGIGLLISIGINNLHHADMRSARNQVIFGVSIMMGLAVPYWANSNPNAINSGNDIADDIITGLLSTAMFVGAFLGFLMDNLLPGSRRERGLESLRSFQLPHSTDTTDMTVDDIYDLPLINKEKYGHVYCCSRIPFLPTYVERKCCRRKRGGQGEQMIIKCGGDSMDTTKYISGAQAKSYENVSTRM